MSEEDKESIVIKSTSLWSSLGIIGKAYNSFIINNDEKDLYNSMIEKEIVEDYKKKFQEIDIMPKEANPIWNSYFEYINVLKSGKVIKKKGGNANRKRTFSKTVSRDSSVPNSNINSPLASKNIPKRKVPERRSKRKNSGKKSKYYISDTESEISELELDDDDSEEVEEEEEEEEIEDNEEQEAIELTEGSEDEEEEEEKRSDDEEDEEEEEEDNDSLEDSEENSEDEILNTRSRRSSSSSRMNQGGTNYYF